MTFWIDAQFDPELAAWLGIMFRVVAKNLREIGLRDAEDIELFGAARRFKDIVIVSKDSDFAELVSRLGAPPQVLWVRFGNRSTLQIKVLLNKLFPEAIRLLEAGEILVEIVEDGE